jgi:AraC-like DNA-binding protein
MATTPSYRVAFSDTRAVSFERVVRNSVHRHSFFEPCIVKSGSGEFEYGGTVHPLREGDLFISDPGVYHEIRSLSTRDLTLCFLAFTVTRSTAPADPAEPSVPSQATLARFMVEHAIHLPGQSQLIPLFEHVTQLSRSQGDRPAAPFHREATLLLLGEIVAALADTGHLSDDERSERRLNDRVLQAIEQRLHEPFRIGTLARACGMSERTLRRRWAIVGERSLTGEINHRRIERASHLLLLPDVSVAEVGYQVGLGSPARFSRLFRSIKGLTPMAYRRRVLTRLPARSRGQPPFRTEFPNGEVREYDR